MPVKKKMKKHSILIVEDSAVQAELLRRLLVAKGYAVSISKNGREGLLTARKLMPSLIISDVSMPLMDGYQMCRKIKAEKTLKDIPVILLTQLKEINDLFRGLKSNAEYYITKPYDEKLLLSNIKSILKTKTSKRDDAKVEKLSVTLSGKHHDIETSAYQLWTLLISTYENAILQNKDLVEMKEILEKTHRLLKTQFTKLQASEARFRSLVNTIPDIIYQIDQNGIFVFLNNAICVLGYKPKELIGKHFSKLILPADLSNVSLSSALKQNEGDKNVKKTPPKLFDERRTGDRITRCLEIEIVQKNSKITRHASIECIGNKSIIAEISSSGVYEVNPKSNNPVLLGTVGVIRDITQRKQMDARVRQMNEEIVRLQHIAVQHKAEMTEKKFNNLIKASTDAIIIMNSSFSIILFNKAAEQLFGYEQKEVCGKQLTQMLPKRHQNSYMQRLNHCNQTGKSYAVEGSFELSIIAKDKTEKIIEMSVSVSKIEGDCIFICIIRDITKRKYIEAALRDSEEKFESISHVAHDAIVMLDHEGKVSYWNSAAEKMFGFLINEVIGNKIEDIIIPDSYKQSQMDGFKNFRASGTGQFVANTTETIALRKDQTVFPIELSVSPLLLKGKWNVVGIIRDISERKQAERKIKDSVKSLQKSLYGTIHALATMAEKRDPYTAGHQQRVANLARAIAKELGYSESRIEGVYISGVIHDLGKMSVPAEILSKPGRITKDEFNIIKHHPQVGYEILEEIEFPWQIADVVCQHHEYMDGSGYPNGLSGEDILEEARILCVADVVEAMASHRPYRPALGIDAALEEIEKYAGTRFDSRVVNVCIKLFKDKAFDFDRQPGKM